MLIFIVKFLLAASAIIVIILVMLQRGKGGGLAGALGGAGGQSAFGTKAGDLFTKITVVVALFWIVISVLTAIFAPNLVGGEKIGGAANTNATQNPGPPPEAPPPGKAADSGAAKSDKGGKPPVPSATDKVPSATEKGEIGSGPAGKSAPSLPTPSGSSATPPAGQK